MASCKSFAQIVDGLYREYNEEAKGLLSGISGGVVAVVSANPVAGLKAKRRALETMDKAEDLARTMERAYSKIVAGIPGAKIGPRLLRFDRWESGKVFGAGDRMFLTAAPLTANSPTLRIRELGGRGKVRVTVCSFDAKGKHREVCEFWVNENKKERRDLHQSFNIRLSGVKDKWISVLLDGRSVAKAFKYKLLLDT